MTLYINKIELNRDAASKGQKTKQNKKVLSSEGDNVFIFVKQEVI